MQPWMDLVLAVDEAWGIGKAGGLPWPKLSADMRHFKEVTSAAPEGKRNAVVMGRRTWESKEVAGRPLPRRRNVVLTRKALAAPEGVLVVAAAEHGLDRALDELAAQEDLGAVFIIGGAELYRQALEHPRCRYVYLTRVAGRYDCDTFVPNLDERCRPDPSWPARVHAENGIDLRIERLRIEP